MKERLLFSSTLVLQEPLSSAPGVLHAPIAGSCTTMTPSEIVHATTQRLHEYKTQLRDWIVGNAAVGANCMLFFLLVETGLVSHVLGVPLSSDCESRTLNSHCRSTR